MLQNHAENIVKKKVAARQVEAMAKEKKAKLSEKIRSKYCFVRNE